MPSRTQGTQLLAILSLWNVTPLRPLDSSPRLRAIAGTLWLFEASGFSDQRQEPLNTRSHCDEAGLATHIDTGACCSSRQPDNTPINTPSEVIPTPFESLVCSTCKVSRLPSQLDKVAARVDVPLYKQLYLSLSMLITLAVLVGMKL